MASTNPTLTWAQLAKTAVANPTNPQDVIDAIATNVALSTTWEVKSSAANELEIGPVSGGALPDIRILIATGVDSGQIRAGHGVTIGVLYIGIAPDGGTLQDAHRSTNPYDTSGGPVRWSGYWKFTGDIDAGADDIDNVHCVVADEVISVWCQETTSEDWWGFVAGAFIDPPNNVDGEGTPGKVYGMMVTGSEDIITSFYQNSTAFTHSGTNSTQSMIGCFDPSDTAVFRDLDRTSTLSSIITPRQETAAGTRVTFPIHYFFEQDPRNYIGALRQIRMCQDGRMRRIVQDGAAVDQSFQVSGSELSDADAISFDNG